MLNKLAKQEKRARAPAERRPPNPAKAEKWSKRRRGKTTPSGWKIEEEEPSSPRVQKKERAHFLFEDRNRSPPGKKRKRASRPGKEGDLLKESL
uniref:Uncharacterized protein n=1 Tax=Waxsystermes virus TaxID=2796639 RepID=A0A7T7GUZ5_9VIRU|nr:hypothetical protein [Waxsystermes virus]